MLCRFAYGLLNAAVVLAMALAALVTIRESVALAHDTQAAYLWGYFAAIARMLADFARGYDATLPDNYRSLAPLAYTLAHIAAWLQAVGGK